MLGGDGRFFLFTLRGGALHVSVNRLPGRGGPGRKKKNKNYAIAGARFDPGDALDAAFGVLARRRSNGVCVPAASCLFLEAVALL